MPRTKPKIRKSIPKALVAKIEFASDRTCCVCRTPNKDYQVHHIDRNPSNNSEQNLAILCLQCHSEAERTGGLGRSLQPELIRVSKSFWESHISSKKTRHEIADHLQSCSLDTTEVPSVGSKIVDWNESPKIKLDSIFFTNLLTIKKSAIAAATPFLNLPAAFAPSRGVDQLILGYSSAFEALAECYPQYHFGRDNGRKYLENIFDLLMDFEERTAMNKRGMMGQYSYCNCSLRVIETIDKLIIETVKLLDGDLSHNSSSSSEFISFLEKWNDLKIIKEDAP